MTYSSRRCNRLLNGLYLSPILYSTIWCGYPALWILDEFASIPGLAVNVLSMIMEVAAKSVYGFALLKFKLGADKEPSSTLAQQILP